MSRDEANTITDKVFDTDNNPVAARLLIWGPEEVDGEACMIAEPTDFFDTAPDPHYEGLTRAKLAADDLRIAIPLRLVGGTDIDPDLFRQACRVTELWRAGEDVGDAIEALGAACDVERARRVTEVFMVIATYSDAKDDEGRPRRFAEEYASPTGREGAEAAALEEHPTLDIAAVVQVDEDGAIIYRDTD